MVKNPSTNAEAPRYWFKSPGQESRKWQLTPVFLPGKCHRQVCQAIARGVTKSQTPLSTHASNYLNEAKKTASVEEIH